MESDLSLTFDDLCAHVGTYLGRGRGEKFGEGAWTSTDKAGIEECVKSGQRQVYVPKLRQGESSPYEWSWLSPVAEVTIPDGEHLVDLPADFGHLVGNVMVSTDTNLAGTPIRVTDIGEIFRLHLQCPDSSGPPNSLCVRPKKGTTPQRGQRFEFDVYPAADDDYTATFQYKILPAALNGARQYPYGGMQYAELFKAACLMAAEEFFDNKRGVWAQKFEELLAAAIGEDQRSKPHWLGYNGDNSDNRVALIRTRYSDRLITIAGSDPS